MQIEHIINEYHQAALDGNISKIEALLKSKSVCIDDSDESGMTVLQQACFKGNLNLVSFLVNSGANVNWSKHKQGYTALMFAAINGNLSVIEYLLSNGADTSAINCLKRTASQMAAFIGNYFAVALINLYIPKIEISYLANRKEDGLSSCVNPLHELVTGINFAPAKVFQFLSTNNGQVLLENYKSVSAILNELSKNYFTPHKTHEGLAIKLHLLACTLQKAGEFSNANNQSSLESLIKQFIRGGDPHGLPMQQEHFLRQSIISFPHMESDLWRQIVKQVSNIEVGCSPTALSILENCITGLSPFNRSSAGRSIDTEPCATCSSMGGGGSEIIVKRCSQCHEVAYCSVACQRLHWFTHKKYCHILKAHYESVKRTNGDLTRSKSKISPSAEDIASISSELKEKMFQIS